MCFLAFWGATKKLKLACFVPTTVRIVCFALEAGVKKTWGTAFLTLVDVSKIVLSTERFF
jgi:hypothetical protein